MIEWILAVLIASVAGLAYHQVVSFQRIRDDLTLLHERVVWLRSAVAKQRESLDSLDEEWRRHRSFLIQANQKLDGALPRKPEPRKPGDQSAQDFPNVET